MSGLKSNLATCLLVMAGLAIHSGCRTANTTVQPAAKPPNYPTGAIELKYYAQGPWDVTTRVDCCDSAGHKFDLYYPKNLGANGFRHPILTWGNGTFGKPQNVASFLEHMASWGFVVIATEDSFTGLGRTILDGVKYMIQLDCCKPNNNIFYHKLDKNQIGAFGHSQGAGGAIRAFMASAGTIKTVVPIELPAQVFCTFGPKCIDTKNLKSGSIFFIDGSNDSISPPTQPSWLTGEQSIEAYYAATPTNVEKVKGTIIGPGHNDIQGSPSVLLTGMFPGASTAYTDIWAIPRRGLWIACKGMPMLTEPSSTAPARCSLKLQTGSS
jgi:hypothetical protein